MAKNKIFLLPLAAVALCALPNVSNKANAETVDDFSFKTFTPLVTPNGKKYDVLHQVEFSEQPSDTFSVVNLEMNKETLLLGYGSEKVGDNYLYYMNIPGGQFQPILSGNLTSKQNICGSSGIMFYLNTRYLKDNTSFKFGFNLLTTANTLSPIANKEGYTYSIDGDKWEKSFFNDNLNLPIPDAFEGYVYFPINSLLSSNSDYPNLTDNLTSVSVSHIDIRMEVNDLRESQSPVYIDSLSFVKNTDEHTHNTKIDHSVTASCEHEGFDVYKCEDCSQFVKKNLVAKRNHKYGNYLKDKDGIAYHKCSDCGHIEINEKMKASTDGDDDLVTITFDYGENLNAKAKKIKLAKGSTITYDDVPVEMYYKDGIFIQQFNAWTSDKDNIEPLNPVGFVANEDKTFYARYIIAEYNDKYNQAISNLSRNGGVYNVYETNVCCLGNSNSSLYFDMAKDFEEEGIPNVLNNSIAGSTSYDLVNYYKALILSYKPKFVVLNMSTNDMAYYFLSEKVIIENMKKCYEMTRKYLPDSLLIITSTLPLPGRTEFADCICRVNDAMDAWTEESEKVVMAKTYELAKEYADNYPIGWDTWTHLNGAGLKSLFSEVVEIILTYAFENNIDL